MSCRYLENTITVEGVITRIRTYDPPSDQTVFNGNHHVRWFKDVLVRVEGDPINKKGKPVTRNLYTFIEPATGIETKVVANEKFLSLKKGSSVRVKYAPIAVNNIMRGCALEIEAL